MTAETISIALCTYNGGRFLREQLASYVAQERLPDELVVCDDGSTDDTLAILRQFADSAPFEVRIQPNAAKLGVARNFSRAIGLCSGNVIALSDQDDIWFPNKLRVIDDAFASDGTIGVVISDAVAIGEDSRSLDYGLWDAVRFTRRERAAARGGRLADVLLRHYVATGATLAFLSTFRELVQPIPPHCLHDAWIAFLVASVAQGHIIDEPLIGYRQHPAQTSGGERLLTLSDQMARARAMVPDDYAATAARFESMRVRLAESPHAADLDHILRRLDYKIRHLRNRERMHRTGGFRLPVVARELLSGRYHRYSHPWKDPLADLFL